jgi:hypothetical protein
MALASRARQVSENRKQNLYMEIDGYTVKVALLLLLLQVIDINTVTALPASRSLVV